LQGKSQMILRFLDRNENTKPTIALEYTYGRRTRGMIKDVANIWELGGGTSLLNLFDIPLTKKNIEISSVLIVVDLSKPEQMWNTFYDLLNAIRKRLDDIMNELNKSTPFVYERIMRTHKKRFSDHQDASMLKPLPIPLAIVGAKYDVFQNFEPENRKNICKILRFMAHSNFASLQMFSTQMENLVIRCRALISHMVFGTTAVKTINTDFNKPLSITAGSDCFEVKALDPCLMRRNFLKKITLIQENTPENLSN
uniref:Cytoplasmic dynein 2 light intermediate chain 1 n=1 Tax=Anisakis simplex TaxID=6269 RepID=A0A0M3J0M0_ANISI